MTVKGHRVKTVIGVAVRIVQMVHTRIGGR